MMVDGEAFIRHSRSGITRYFVELIDAFSDAQHGVDVITPYRYVANQHLGELAPDRYRRVPLPSKMRPSVFGALNRAARRRDGAAVDLIHHTLDMPALMDIGPVVPRVATVYDFTLELHPELFPGWNQALEDQRAVIDRADGLLCISNTTYEDLLKFHPDLDKPVAITRLGVSDAFSARRASPVPGVPEQYVLFVGIRHANKNAGMLFDAFAQIAASRPGLRLVLSGNLLDAGEQQHLERLGIAERTVCVRVTDAQLPGLYANAQVFAFASKYEGFGLPVLEAMASGVPVVASAIPAVQEVADSAARYFDVADLDGFVAALVDVLDDTALRATLTRDGRARAREFTWQRTAMATAAAYSQIRESG